jgi:hypothetical protein
MGEKALDSFENKIHIRSILVIEGRIIGYPNYLSVSE